jgi:hypothetical protein
LVADRREQKQALVLVEFSFGRFSARRAKKSGEKNWAGERPLRNWDFFNHRRTGPLRRKDFF